VSTAPDPRPYHIVGYRGYATGTRALILGRVLEEERIAAPDATHSRWRNLVDTLRRIESDPMRHAKVRVRLGNVLREVVADDEGFLHEWVTLSAPLPHATWHPAELELVTRPNAARAVTVAPILVPPASPMFGVISDMDDTVLQSEVTNFLRAAQLMLLENARTRLPFPGVAAFYRALEAGGAGTTPSAGGGNPIFYVSSSPWNLYDVITEFLEAQRIPAGPLLLRDWDLGRALLRTSDYKERVIAEILSSYPTLPFMLVGDSGQEDPEIYSTVVRANPGRILAVYIRNVSPRPERSAAIRALAAGVQDAGSTLVLADDTLTVAKHAAAHGWIDARRLDEIAAERRADEGTSAAKVETPGVEPVPPAPTIVVDPDVKPKDVA
jgi:phosphatidate phosphatase APP1